MTYGAAILAAALATTAAAAPAGGPVGVWRTPEDGGSLVRIEPCGDALCGRIVTSPRLRAYPDRDGRTQSRPEPAWTAAARPCRIQGAADRSQPLG